MIASTKRDPSGLCVPRLPLRQEDPRADLALGGMIRRLDTFMAYKRPQRLATFEDRPAHARHLRDPACLPSVQQPLDLAPDLPHGVGQAGMRQGPIADPMAPVEHLAGLYLQGFPSVDLRCV